MSRKRGKRIAGQSLAIGACRAFGPKQLCEKTWSRLIGSSAVTLLWRADHRCGRYRDGGQAFALLQAKLVAQSYLEYAVFGVVVIYNLGATEIVACIEHKVGVLVRQADGNGEIE